MVQTSPTFSVGTIVEIDRRFSKEKGIIYEQYTDFDDSSRQGNSIITESGRDLGGFSADESELYLHPVRESGLNYQFQNVTQLAIDFESKIKPFFQQ